MSNLTVVSANSVHLTPEANSPSIPNYQWQFLSASEKAAVDASLKVIMNERFKNITMNVVDASGVPYTGTVRVTQDSTSFIHFAGDPDGAWEGPWLRDYSWRQYLALSPSRSYTIAGSARWNIAEPVRGTFDFSNFDSQWNWAAHHGMVDFHLNIGPSFGPCCYWIPEWAKNLDYDSLKSAIQEYDEALVSHFKGRVQYYEIWWEVNGHRSNNNWPMAHIIGIIKMEALTIRSMDPSARIYVDFIDTRWGSDPENGDWTIEDFVKQLLASGVPFDIIGDETEYGNYWPGAGIDTLYNRLIAIAKFGKPIYVWEDSLGSHDGPECDRPETWHGTPSEDKQAEYMVAETLVYLGNPSVLGVHWFELQDYDACHCGVISYPDGARKKSFYALEQLWNSLMVNETVQIVNGVAAFRGLAGNYSISVEGYETEPSAIHVSDGKQNTFSLVLRSLAMRDQAAQTILEVGSNLTATSGGVLFQSSEAKNLLNQSFDEDHTAEQMFQSKDYAAALQHAQKALDLINQAYSKESEYVQEQQQEQQEQQRQQLLTRVVENVVVVALVGGCAVAVISYLRRRKPTASR